MGTRIIAAVIGLAIVLPVIYLGGYFVAGLVALVMLIGLDEFARMAFPGRRAWALGALVPPAVSFYAVGLYGLPGMGTAVATLGFLWLMAAALFRKESVDDAAPAAGLLVLGAIWAGALLLPLPLIRDSPDGIWWIVLLLAVTWLGDSGAYFAGRTFGKHKLYKKISPNKTWEGAIGGVIAAVIGGALVQKFLLPDQDLVTMLILAAILDVAGVLGDLTESMFKRSFGVKDSGSIMPGHGGILDRIDSLLFSGPLLLLYLQASGL